MKTNASHLPVYEQKQRILDSLAVSQVIVVQSPTGSGKTTQLPIILHEAGFSRDGVIAVTQPRRIAALSVSEFIAKQLGTTYPGTVGYKMRFEDKTDASTRIKIMTDGILLQEMKLDPWLSAYSVVLVDEAHERSLNIDFVLGLLKRVLTVRSDLKVIISSATMNTELFSAYFDDCPIITIDTITFPVATIYDPPAVSASSGSLMAQDALLEKIDSTVDRIMSSGEKGDILIFLPGEKAIKECCFKLSHAPYGRKLLLVPLYGRLAKEEQERVFIKTPSNKKKVVVSTNIAETSVTIAGITSVIDSGLAKLNYYSPKTFTSSLIETPVSKASCNQRRGRAGRTQPGNCYRLYERKDYETRQLYTLEEIYRTDLSEVVLRMAELGISDFEQFDFISPPNRDGLRSAIETLNLLKALEDDHTLSQTGKYMALFPLMPRQSRMIVEALQRYPSVMDEALTAAAFLSAQSPFVLPAGQETDARRAHHKFRHPQGDFVSYITIFKSYCEAVKPEVFCEKSYLDARVMAEIKNIKEQLSLIISDMGIPVSGGGSLDEYLCCVASGMLQFVCVRSGRESYRSLTADHIQIHPGSCMFRSDPEFIVAGEIVRTSRMFAMSVSPLSRNMLARIDENLEDNLLAVKRGRSDAAAARSDKGTLKKAREKQNENTITIGGEQFEIQKIKGKKLLILPWEQFNAALSRQTDDKSAYYAQIGGLRAKVLVRYDGAVYELLTGEKTELISKIARVLNMNPASSAEYPKKKQFHIGENAAELIESLQWILRITPAKVKGKELGFICLFTDGNGTYWYKVSRGFLTALNESLSSLETLIDEQAEHLSDEQKAHINTVYRALNSLYD